jgi:hypothetical protein
MQSLFSFDRGMRVEKTLRQTFASQLSSTLMQLLFSFDQGMGVEKTLVQTLASQLSSTLTQLLFSFDRGMRVEKTLMQKNSRFSTLINSQSRLTVFEFSYMLIYDDRCNFCRNFQRNFRHNGIRIVKDRVESAPHSILPTLYITCKR